MSIKKIFLLILFLSAHYLHAQNEKVIEQKLLKTFKQIHYWVDHRESSDKISSYDSITAETENFLADLLKYTSANPSTISYPFKALQKEGLTIITSDDGLFRIY